MYFDKFILSISRLLDPAKQSYNENLSIFQLIKIANDTHYSKIEELQKSIDNIKNEAQDIRKLRRKFIAHRDLSHAINLDLKVEPIEFEKIKEIFSKMSKCINEIEKHLELPQTSFYWGRDQYGAKALVKSLQNSLIYRDIRTNDDKWEEDEERAKTSQYYIQ